MADGNTNKDDPKYFNEKFDGPQCQMINQNDESQQRNSSLEEDDDDENVEVDINVIVQHQKYLHRKMMEIAAVSDHTTKEIEAIRRSQKAEFDDMKTSNGAINRKLELILNKMSEPRENGNLSQEPRNMSHSHDGAGGRSQLRPGQELISANNPTAPGPHGIAEDQRGSEVVQDRTQFRNFHGQTFGEHMGHHI